MWIVLPVLLIAAFACGNDAPAAVPIAPAPEAPEARTPALPGFLMLPSIDLAPPTAPAPGPRYTFALAADGPGHRAFVLGPDGNELGRWTFAGDPTPEALAPATATIPPEASVSIAADRSLRYAAVVAVMDALRTRGITHMAIAVQPSDAPPAPVPAP